MPSLDEFDYHLPEQLIALTPTERRDASRLMVVRGGEIGHHQFSDLPSLLKRGDILVLNDTKVFPAALRGIRPARAIGGGGDVSVDINLLGPATESETEVVWRALCRPGKRLAIGDEVRIADGFIAHVIAREGAEVRLAFAMGPATFAETLDAYGAMPLPPYIARRRAADETDKERYQTVYAAAPGSVAAPTAGLHFTDDIFAAMDERGIEREFVTLHVGAGTFLPVTTDDIEEHKMHAEWGEVSPAVAQRLTDARSDGRRIIAVGTTATRLLETAATDARTIAPFRGETDIFIRPGYEFRAVDALITNFHLPRSTLLMLVSALVGRDQILQAYAAAVAAQYRFFSYGDACLLEP